MIKSIFKKSFEWTKDKKDYFVLIFFMQALYLGVFLYIFVSSFYQIMTHVNYLMEGFYSITAEQVSANLVENPLGLYAHYTSLATAVATFIILSYLAYLLLNGINWSLTNKLVNVNQHFLRFFPKYIVFTLLFTLPLIIICYFFARIATITGLQTMFLTLMGIVILIFWYFMTISFGLIERYRIKDFKSHLFKTFHIGIVKAGILAPISIFIFVLLAFISVLIYLAADYFFITMILVVLFIAALVWARILCMTAVREASITHIAEKKKRKKSKR